jgi:hypothetical protein
MRGIYMIYNVLLARLTGFTLLLTPLLCSGVSPKIAPDLVGVSPQKTVTVIIRFSSPLDNAVKQKLKDRGGNLKAELNHPRGVLHVSAAALQESPMIPRLSTSRRTVRLGRRSILPVQLSVHRLPFSTVERTASASR